MGKFAKGNIQKIVCWVGIMYVVCTNMYPTFFIVIIATNGVWVATLASAIGIPVGVQKSEIKMT